MIAMTIGRMPGEAGTEEAAPTPTPRERIGRDWKELSMAERADAIRRLEAFQVAENLSNDKVAGMIGYSSAVWCQIRNGKYSGNIDKVLAAAKAFLEQRRTVAATTSPDFVQTRIGRQMLRIMRYAAETGNMAMILTRAGCGKTSALREFARLREGRAVLVLGSEYTNTKAGVLRSVAEAMGLRTAAAATFETLAVEVRKELARAYAGGIGQPRIILVDEAQSLKPQAINMLRNLHDDPACRAIVVLAGTWLLQKDLRRLRGLAGGFEQITSRIGAAFAMGESEAIEGDDVRAVAEATVQALGFARRLPAESLKVLARIAAEDGALRNVVKRLQAAHRIAELAGKEAGYTVHELEYAAQLMGRDSPLDQKAPPWAAARPETHEGVPPAVGSEARASA